MTIILSSHHYNIIKKIIEKYPYKFLVFGSRAKGTAHKFSDLDLCLMDKIPGNTMFEIEESFRESDLPFKVEILEWSKASDDFRKIIDKDLIEL